MKARNNHIDISEISRAQKKQPAWKHFNTLYKDNMIYKSKTNMCPSFLHFFRARVILNTHMDVMSSLLTNS
jgi:hypothetical protein